MLKQDIKTILFLLVALTLMTTTAFAADGWASQGGGTTGGQGGTTVTVNNAADFILYAQDSGQDPYIIQVSGNITLPSTNIRVRGNKTVIGLPGSHISGNLKCYRLEESNNIFKNLDMDNYDKVGDGDCISLDSVNNIWIDHCTFTDGGDGNVDIKNGSDYITISWCIFQYTYDSGHNFSNLIGHSDDNGSIDSGHLLVTFHHNWWYTLSHERMPRVRFGQVHVYNNYYDCPGNNYCIRACIGSQLLIESNYFDSVKDPYYVYVTTGTDGQIEASDNVFNNCTGLIDPGTDNVFTPPYSYTLDDPYAVPGIVMAGAGTGSGGDTTPPAAPTGLAAVAGNGTVSLDWDDNGESDLDGYNVYRSTSSGSGYSRLNGSLLSTSDYVDNTVTNGTTYYYVVTAVDTSSNESTYSDEASATPQGSPAQYMHVDSIELDGISCAPAQETGQAIVTIHDEYGDPVVGALVDGMFSGDFDDVILDQVTDASGQAVFTASGCLKKPSFSFCVSDVTHATLTYDEASNTPGTSCGGGPCTPTEVYVEAIDPGTISCGGANKNGQVTVTIYDDCGNPIAGALVDGTFTGDFDDVFVDEVTDTNGQAVFTSTGCIKKPSYTFCVDDVTAALPYNSANNVETCDSN
ncbi:MAG: hypothetical protein JW806_05790 [Sedimentisphaerales bacterium]|nr:hypothetical protein [Sedimentisphaerales bacterium]